MSKAISIIGLGWLGEPLAVALHGQGHTVRGTTTTLEKLTTLARHPFYVGRLIAGSEGLTGDWEMVMDGSDVVVLNIPPRRKIEDIEAVYPAQIGHLLAAIPETAKVIFVSSTAVYANGNGEVTETQDCTPEKPSGHAVKAAEQVCQAAYGDRCTVLRLAGLIGPGRHPGRFLAGKRALKNPEVPVNLIHLDDCIALISEIIAQDCFGEVLNGVADEHPIREDFYRTAAERLALPAPVFQAGTTSAFKVVSNAKSKAVLGITYRYADPADIFHPNHMPAVAIVGAGPGDLGLLTIKAYRLIQEAEVILHDNLVSDDIMRINPAAERVYVGRKYGDQTCQVDRQLRINRMLAQYYREGRKVVRLKSGDPYIFGRASEEATYLTEHGVPFEMVPGISAALAAANLCNIPVTARGASNSFMICTAHTADYATEQIQRMGHVLKQGTVLAVYMGLKSFHIIIDHLLEHCQDGSIPIQAVSNVSRPNQVLLASTLKNIQADLQKAALKMPVVFLIGAKPITHEEERHTALRSR